ncbi:Lipase [Trichoderma simmonsii]|uniref:Lipase n=1 Tax=Trichoderma simmonsii TaxID=1491479 RepID=A0A8G0L4R3_9HYPO|nr:Lipase [Trichoderma simmonsii]
MAPNLNDPNGLVNLQTLAQEVENIAPDDKSVPIVFVPGFTGWGAPLFGAINYFGGEIDIATLLANRGYTVIVASIAPISTNWERACELYRQLTFGQFSTVDLTTNTLAERNDVDVKYGNYFGPNRGPKRTCTTNRRRAILYSRSPGFENWKWDKDHKVHFVCHSQGGNTVRFLLDLMRRNNGYLHTEYFGQPGRDDWAISVTTLGTPHRGTTIIDVLESFVDRQLCAAVGLIARLFATASFYPPEKRAFDLQLDHWGICRNTGETFQGMLERLESPDGPVWKWLYSKNNGFYDNSIEGVHELSQKTINTSPNIFYFSLSFHATKAFPTDWPDWGKVALNEFPFKTGIPIPFLGQLTNMVVNGAWTFLPAIVDFPAFVQWITQSVISRVLRIQGYNMKLPNPGEYIPREDVIPIMMPTVYAMGGQQLTQAQREILEPGFEDWLQNDGIVNTASMTGPRGSVRNVSSLPDVNFSIPGKRDVYWHLGVNDTMDHADEIGIFIERDTSVAMENMYVNIAKLVSRLPH